MSVPSLEDLLAELDRQDELDVIDEQSETPAQVADKPEVQETKQQPEQQEQEGGSSASAAARPRRGGRFSDLLGSGSGTKQPVAAPSIKSSLSKNETNDGPDGDASTRDDERSPRRQVAQEHHRSEFGHSSSSEEAEGGRVTELQQLDGDPERLRAQAEAAAFEERQRKAREEAEESAREEERRRVEAAREAWERHRMAAEEAEERRVRANRHASILEDKTRKLLEKQSSKRKKLREDERKQRQQEKDKRKEEKMRSEAARMSEKIRKMAENGYALGPSGWVRMDWLSGPADVGDPNFQVVQGPISKEEEEEDPEGGSADDVSDGLNDPLEVVDQRPPPEEEQPTPEARPLEDVLAELDKTQLESIASGAQAADLETVLDIVAADEERDLAKAAAVEVRQGYEKLGEVEEEEDDVPQDATETATKVLRVAKTRRPDAKFGEAINEESALKPFNDFQEEKQQGSNSYEERQARSAAIQAKLQAARNRMSIVRYERNTNSAPTPVQEKRSQPAPKKPKAQPKMPARREERYSRSEPSGWGWLQAG